MTKKTLKIATRKSPLALWQAEYIRSSLLSLRPDINIELLPLKTTGDKFLKDKLLNIGGKGLFVKELEEALLDQRADLAVHSMKDVPAQFPKGLMLSTICERHSPYDALLSKQYDSLADLPQNAVVGTVSLRRQTQLLAIRPDLQVKSLRGNILSRISKMEAGDYDAIILAVSGLERMKLEHLIKERFRPSQMIPSCGQGAMGIECRTEDKDLHHLLSPLNDELTQRCVSAERHVNQLLGGNCHSPLAVFCSPTKNGLVKLTARLLSLDGQKELLCSQTGALENAMELAEKCANELLAKGAEALIKHALDNG